MASYSDISSSEHENAPEEARWWLNQKKYLTIGQVICEMQQHEDGIPLDPDGRFVLIWSEQERIFGVDDKLMKQFLRICPILNCSLPLKEGERCPVHQIQYFKLAKIPFPMDLSKFHPSSAEETPTKINRQHDTIVELVRSLGFSQRGDMEDVSKRTLAVKKIENIYYFGKDKADFAFYDKLNGNCNCPVVRIGNKLTGKTFSTCARFPRCIQKGTICVLRKGIRCSDCVGVENEDATGSTDGIDYDYRVRKLAGLAAIGSSIIKSEQLNLSSHHHWNLILLAIAQNKANGITTVTKAGSLSWSFGRLAKKLITRAGTSTPKQGCVERCCTLRNEAAGNSGKPIGNLDFLETVQSIMCNNHRVNTALSNNFIWDVFNIQI